MSLAGWATVFAPPIRWRTWTRQAVVRSSLRVSAAMILGVHHPALSVPSLEAALDFYCGKLGFESVMNAEIPSGIPPMNEAFGVADAGCKVAIIKRGNSAIEPSVA